MRLAVISDVHGNLPALDAVLAGIGDDGVDMTVNLGDLLSGYVQPRVTTGLLSPAHLRWMASLPMTLSPAPGVLAFHGTPTDDLQYLLHTVTADGAREATLDEVRERVGDVSGYTLLLCGHTHLAGSLRLPGGPLIVNPGSVGWPAYTDDEPFPHEMAAGDPRARYALVDDASGQWEVSWRAVDYRCDDAAACAEAFGRPDVAKALRTGRN